MTLVLPEYENWENIEYALAKSEADILLVSPHTNVSNNYKRIDSLNQCIPEMNNMRYGDNLESKKYPNLRMVIQISHKSYPGTEKFKVN